MRIALTALPIHDVRAHVAKLSSGVGVEVLLRRDRERCQAEGVQTLYELAPGRQISVRSELIGGHADWVRTQSQFVCDHSVFVYLADWMRWHWHATSTEKWEEVIQTAARAVSCYDQIQHVVDAPRAGYDGYAWLDPLNARQQDCLIRQLYRDFGCEGRVQEVEIQERVP